MKDHGVLTQQVEQLTSDLHNLTQKYKAYFHSFAHGYRKLFKAIEKNDEDEDLLQWYRDT